jgi:hypothetical protein
MKTAWICLSLLACGCASVPNVDVLSAACQQRYKPALPDGAVAAGALQPLRLDPARMHAVARPVYACVAATVTESGEVKGASVLETNSAEFAQYFRGVVEHGRYQAATYRGAPMVSQVIFSATLQ